MTSNTIKDIAWVMLEVALAKKKSLDEMGWADSSRENIPFERRMLNVEIRTLKEIGNM